jgi:hypothetical protein
MDRATGHPPSAHVVSSRYVRNTGTRVKVPVPGHEVVVDPVIEVIREGDIVRALDITCSCGQRFRVLCDYDPTAIG